MLGEKGFFIFYRFHPFVVGENAGGDAVIYRTTSRVLVEREREIYVLSRFSYDEGGRAKPLSEFQVVVRRPTSDVFIRRCLPFTYINAVTATK